ncbi:metal-dependent transcriptional regulator, partial [uncultured Clostridium sp.]|uniref:metal-dependent transcriptional regulator n=1 Tax=uncultured Clostridium sp. TaxID=59620 RepID=UPI000A7DBE00
MEENFYTTRGYEIQSYTNNLLTSSMEDYLEMIYRGYLSDGYIRLSKLASLLNVKDSSASKMVQKLGKLKLINYEKYGVITLTTKGIEIGKFLLYRHNILEDFLRLLGSEDNLLVETELIEHVISKKTVNNINLLNRFFYDNEDILNKFLVYKDKSLSKDIKI